MRPPAIDDSRDLPIVEALYQIIAAQMLEKRIFLSRQQFLRWNFPVVVTVDGLVGLVKAHQPLNLVMPAPAQSHGLPVRSTVPS